MNALNGKNVLFCRPQNASAAFETAFRSAGANVGFFEPYRIEFADPAEPQTSEILGEIDTFDWLLLSSQNGVDALVTALEKLQIDLAILSKIPVGTVGVKAAKRLIELVPDAEIYAKAANLQSLLSHISQIYPEETVRLLHVTSVQSLENIAPEIPGNVTLQRVPLYQTIANERFDSENLTEILTGKFDVFVFSSPTSFDYFRQIIAGDDLLRSTAIAVFGETTAAHLRENGIDPQIIPDIISPEELCKSTIDFFEQSIKLEHLSNH